MHGQTRRLQDHCRSGEPGELTFPANVNASLRLQQALNDPDCHVEAAAKLIQADLLLAARSVAIANSVAYNRSGTEISSVRAAVQRLGVRTLQSLVAALIVRQIGSQITDPALLAKVNQLWEHTAHVAALSQVIARRVTHVDPDTALFAGIMHEVAGFYMLSCAGEYPEVMEGEPEDWVEHGEVTIGRGVMAKLDVPEAVSRAIESMWVACARCRRKRWATRCCWPTTCRRSTRRCTSAPAPPPCKAPAPSTSSSAKARCTRS